MPAGPAATRITRGRGNRPTNLTIMAEWRTRPASAAHVEAVAKLRAVVPRADPERLGRYDGQGSGSGCDGFTPAHTWVIGGRVRAPASAAGHH